MAAGNPTPTPDKNSPAAPAGAAPTPASHPAPKSNILVTILSVVNLLGTIGMFAVLYISFQKEKQRPSIEDIAAKTANPEGEGEKGEKGHGGEHGEKGKEEEGKAGEGAKKKNPNYGKMITLDQFTVNLSTPGSVSPKFVRVNISLEVPNDDIEGEVVSKMPQVRNAIIDLFNSKRPADLATADGRDYLKEEIRNALNSFLVSGKIKGVYFTSFALAG